MKRSSVDGSKTWTVNEAESKTLAAGAKNNREVFGIIGGKCSSMDSVQGRPRKMVGLGRPEELHRTIVEGA